MKGKKKSDDKATATEPVKEKKPEQNILISGVNCDAALEIALPFIAEGANLILLEQDRALCNKICAELEKRSKDASILPLGLDMTMDREAPYNSVVQRISQAGMRHIDAAILLNGDAGFTNNLFDFPNSLWRQVTNRNLDGAFLLMKALLPFLMSSPNPTLVFSVADKDFVSSSGANAGDKGNPVNIAYKVSSYALNGLVLALTDEMATSHISVCGAEVAGDLHNASEQRKKEVAKLLFDLATARKKRYHGKILSLP